MTWHRGLAVCIDEQADAVEAALSENAIVCRLAQHSGETAFAFAARNLPEIEVPNVQYAGIDEGSISVVVGGDPTFEPTNLVLRA